jgi:hypothetical protein
MLVRRVDWWKDGNWNVWLIRDIFHPREDLADRDVARILFHGIVRAPKEDRKNVRSGNVLLEYAVEHRIALGLVFERSMDS